MRATLSTDEFEISHGRAPRGRGNWIFAPRGRENDTAAWVSINGTYSEARAQLHRMIRATTHGARDWVVLP
jgi:hypothetical protein